MIENYFMLMGKGEGKESEEAKRDKVCRMIEEGYLMSEICEELKLSSASYWKIKKEWASRKRRESREKREFHRMRVRVHEKCKLLLMRHTKEVARYCEEGMVEEIERMLEGLPLVSDIEEFQRDIEVLQKKEKEIEDAELKAGVKRREREYKTFLEELKIKEGLKLKELEKSAEELGLSPEEKEEKEKRIRALYGDFGD